MTEDGALAEALNLVTGSPCSVGGRDAIRSELARLGYKLAKVEREKVLDELLSVESGVPKKSIMNFCYSAFMIAKGKNAEDGGPTDWFTDTKPVVEEWVEKIRAKIADLGDAR